MKESQRKVSPRKTHPREEFSWRNMLSRCNNPNATGYSYYGGRGVKVCDSWIDFKNFLADMGNRPEGTTLDRIDSNRHYSKDNCRWATPKEQANNTSKNVLISFAGYTKTLSEWANEIGIKPNTLQYRLYREWSIERALTTS